ncbi:MAG: UTP--glucose-1-phosphate uridylyltransferase [Acidiferrobacterales bacterium]|nr:UTP--glucose-1-phosphate uridylyltransferase [Acidiferrobacterales bacterium]
MSGSVRTVVLPIAGLGTRFLPATKAITKEMLPVVDRPLIEYAVQEARSAGIERFVFVVSAHSDLVAKHFSRQPDLQKVLEHKGKLRELRSVQENALDPDSIHFVIQDKPLGLGHAVLCARDVIEEDFFAVLLPDDLVLWDKPCMQQMVELHNDVGSSILAVEQIDNDNISSYGVITPTESSGRVYRVDGVVEKPRPEDAPSNLAAIGRYVLASQIFSHLEKIKAGHGGEIQLTDAINSIASEQPVHALRFMGTRYDCGSKAGYIAANIAYARQDPVLMAKVAELSGSD